MKADKIWPMTRYDITWIHYTEWLRPKNQHVIIILVTIHNLLSNFRENSKIRMTPPTDNRTIQSQKPVSNFSHTRHQKTRGLFCNLWKWENFFLGGWRRTRTGINLSERVADLHSRNDREAIEYNMVHYLRGVVFLAVLGTTLAGEWKLKILTITRKYK